MLYFIIIAAFALSYVLFRPSLILSYRVGAIDFPNTRKIHFKPIARGGGFEFFIAFSVMLGIIPIRIDLKIPLLLSGIVIFIIGFLDDAINISPFMKLSGQFLALAVYQLISELLNYEISIFQGILCSIWIIFITNATNIIDGLDGLAGGVCSSQALCLAVISLIVGNIAIFTCSLILFGAIIGFLPHNFPRAKIFMGDCGALFLGFSLAILSSRLIIESNSFICLLAILLVFRVPSYEAIFSFIRRIIKGKNPFYADRGHFHHKLIDCGFSRQCASLALITLSLAFGFLGILLASV